MFGHAAFLVRTARNVQAIRQLDEFDRVALQAGDHASLFDGERLRAFVDMHLGKLVEVRVKTEALAKKLAEGVPPSKVARYQEERYIQIHMILTFSTWLTGQPERGLAMAEKLILKTEQVRQLNGQSIALAFVAMPLALMSGQIDTLERFSMALQRNLDLENAAYWRPVHRFYAAVIRYEREGLAHIDDLRLAVDELLQDGLQVRAPMYLGVLAKALLEAGKLEKANDVIESALSLQRQSKENWCLPELLRLKALTIAALGEREQARTALGRALECAITIGASSLELRIVNDLADMAIANGNNDEAVELLAHLYESFEESSATEDLKKAARLLSSARQSSYRSTAQ
jgi:tetratricopeptide (TPR) repeat protein